MPALRVQTTFAMFNAGRKYTRDEQFRRNMKRFLDRFPDASKGLVEIDEADPANEFGITKNLLSEQRHRVLGSLRPDLTADLEPFEFAAGRVWTDLMGEDEVNNLSPKMFKAQFVGAFQATPIITPGTNKIALLGAKVDLTTEGKKGLSPHRVCVQAGYAAPSLDAAWIHLNGHFPFNWPAGWKTCRDTWCDIVRENKKRGFTQFITIDSNKHGKTVELHPTQKVFWGQNGIDKGIMIPGDSATIRPKGSPIRVDANIDGHDMWGRRVLILP